MRFVHLLILLLLINVTCYSQRCTNTASVITYAGAQPHLVNKAVSASDDCTITIGDAGEDKHKNAWISKRNRQGNIIWSRQYFPVKEPGEYGFFSRMHFFNIVPSSASTYIINGYAERHSENTDGSVGQFFAPCGIIVCIDESGNVLWSYKFIDQNSLKFNYTFMYCTSAYLLQDGNCVVYLQEARWNAKGAPPYGPWGRVMCITPQGSLKWQLPLKTNHFYPRYFDDKNSPQIIQEADGSIIIADKLVEYDPVFSEGGGGNPVSAALHILSLRPVDGHINWRSGSDIPIPESPDITSKERRNYDFQLYSLKKLSGGNLSIIGRFGLFVMKDNVLSTDYKIMNIITDKVGKIKKVISYALPYGTLYHVNSEENRSQTEGQTIMFSFVGSNEAIPGDSEFTSYKYSLLAKINDDGEVVFARQYNPVQEPSVALAYSFCTNENGGYTIFFNENKNNLTQSKVVITDSSGNIKCASTDTSITAIQIKWPGITTQIPLDFLSQPSYNIVMLPLTITNAAFPLTKTTDCQDNATCCTDIVDTLTTQNIEMCEGSSYRLPDDHIIYSSGHYDFVSHMASGCDSFFFYNVNFVKKPHDLLSVSDTCFDENHSLLLQAAPGYNVYNWNGNITNTPSYTAKKEGLYILSVSNNCGIAKDTVQIYQICRFPVSMPSAFTPNGDGNNDIFRIPPSDKNKFEKLQIYNRFGQLIFQSEDKNLGWNGISRQVSQQAGNTYLYRIKMRDLKGAIFTQSGTFVLVK